MNNQTSNTILALVLSLAVFIGWTMLFPPAQTVAPEDSAATAGQVTDGSTDTAAASTETAVPATTVADANSAIAKSPRVDIDTPALTGSIALVGGRIDDLHLKDYRETIDENSPTVTLLTPADKEHAYYALYGWAPGGNLAASDVPGANTLWSVESGTVLTADSPVTLAWTNDKGMTFRRTIAVDEKFMFSVTQSVENGSGDVQRLAPYGVVARNGMPEDLANRGVILHEGAIQEADGELTETKYKKMADMPAVAREGALAEITEVGHDGWIGFTDHYWETLMIPEPGQAFTGVTKFVESAEIYQTEARMPTQEVAPGASASITTMLFAGAKDWATIRDYEQQKGIVNFIDSIDWGMFFFITKPMFWLLHNLHMMIGNMGWAIIALTFVVKFVLLPLAYRSYASMARMRELQPEMEKIKEAAGDDKQKQQMQIMELYKTHKVNPASGCLPILLQIPIWFSLYKVIYVTLELRHQAWIGWIQDLSAPDPSSILNLFGLINWTAPDFLSFFALGVLPILLGISMWLQQKLNPPATDATQAQIMAWMPWVFMFMLGRFASGLVLYWIANNTLTFLQQYTIMWSHGKRPDLFGNIFAGFKKKPETEKKK